MPEWLIGLIGAAFGLIVSEIFSFLRERRANRRELLLRRWDEQRAILVEETTAATEGLLSMEANWNGTAPSLAARIDSAFGEGLGLRTVRLLSKIRAEYLKNPEHETPQLVRLIAEFDAVHETLVALCSETQQRLDLPPTSDAKPILQAELKKAFASYGIERDPPSSDGERSD